jgi:hypothetical protein
MIADVETAIAQQWCPVTLKQVITRYILKKFAFILYVKARAVEHWTVSFRVLTFHGYPEHKRTRLA